MSNSRTINWYGSPLIRAIGTALLFLSLVSVPIVTSAQNLGQTTGDGTSGAGRAGEPA